MTGDGSGLSSFVEISFAVNLLAGAFESFRGYLVKALKNCNDEFLSTIQVIEVDQDKARQHLPILVADIQTINSDYDGVQGWVCKIAKIIAIIFACLCVLVVYSASFSAWNALLIVPYPLYVIISLTVFWVHRRRAKRCKNQHEFFLDHYESNKAKEIRSQMTDALKSLK